MSRLALAVLGVCVALGGCGEKFVAHGVPGGAGAPSAGQGGANTAGATTGGGAGNDSSAGALADAGESGAETAGVGGLPGNGGSGGLLGSAGSVIGSGGALTEPPVPEAGLLLWLRADHGVQQKDGKVQVWLDQSGNQTDASQISTSAQPKYLVTGFNGRPTLEFDGQEQFLKFAEGFGDFSHGLAGLIVAKPTKSACASMLEFSNGSEIDDIALGMWQDKWTYEVASPYIQAGNVDHDAFSLYAINHRPTGPTDLRIDGSVLGSLDMPLPVVPDSGIRANDFLGHTLYNDCQYFEGQISELILYSRALSNSELTAIEKYLDAHWALSAQGTLPPTPAL